MNLPFFFLKSLQKMSSRVREHRDHTKQYIFHHGLIKFIISTVLQKKGKTWDYFLFWSGFQSEKEDQSKSRQMNKSHSLVKKLKKEVIIEAVEETTQMESSAQKLEEPVGGQQKKIDEDNQLKISKDLEEVPATVLKKQEEKESVKIDQDINDVQENMADVSILSKMESEDIQVLNEKTKGKSMARF